jgi:carbamate kinase
MRVILSIGGNVLIRRNEKGTIEEQWRNAKIALAHAPLLVKEGHSIIITHGNGPVVGNIFIRNEAAKDIIPPMPLYICNADSAGGIGAMLQQTLRNELVKAKVPREVVTVVTQTVVSAADSAFRNPAKPVGPYYSKEEALVIAKEKNWTVLEDAARGYRRFVPSPRPTRIVEAEAIGKLASTGVVVIAAGGGGVPVVESADGMLTAVDAVIDKDLSTAVLTREVKAELFINLTQIDMAYLDFGKAAQRGIKEMSVKEAGRYLREGHFLAGSMGPKIEAAIEFIEGGGREAVITAPELLKEALRGRAGTRVYAG